MKAINNFIVEHLKYSTFPINEKLKISSKSNINIYTCHPKDKFELREILEERLKKDKNADLNDIDVSQITDLNPYGLLGANGLFEGLDPHNINISEWDVSKVTDMTAMFYSCYNFNADISNWNVSNVENMLSMFNGCSKFNCDLNDWNVSKVENMRYMFSNCEHFNCDLSNWNVSNVIDMEYMFYNCYDFVGNGLEKWKVSNFTDMDWMFDDCKSLKNKPSWYK